MISRRADAIGGLAIAVLGAVLLIQARGIDRGAFRDLLGTRGLPIAVSVLLIVGGLIIAARYPWGRLQNVEDSPLTEGADDQEDHPVSIFRPWYVLGVCFAYCYIIQFLGFLITTPLLMCSSMFIVSGLRRKVVFLLVVPVVFTLLIFGLFAVLLGVRLPEGPFGEFLVRHGLPTALANCQAVSLA